MGETPPSVNSFHSPTSPLAAKRTAPPQTSCIPAKAIADTPVARRCPTREPAAHDRADPSRSRTIAGSTDLDPDEIRRHAMRATPASPGISPNIASLFGLIPGLAGVALIA